jgi:hypothetical protein
MTLEMPIGELNVSDAKHLPADELNPGDANPPSRPGIMTTFVFTAVLTAILLYVNWTSAKGLFGLG